MNHGLSNIHPKAQIGANCIIEPFVTITEDVVIGDNCHIYSNAVIHNGARIGNNVQIFPGAVVSAIPQDLKYRGEETYTFIGDNTIIRECVTVNKGTVALGKTVVGSNVLLMAYAHIAHDCVVHNNAIVANAVNLAGHVTIDEFAIVGGMSAIHQFVRIGRHTMIQGGSLIGKDIPPYVKGTRFPIRYSGVNTIGLRRRGYTEESIHEIQEIYRVLFVSGKNTRNALAEIEARFPVTDIREEILTFVRGSERGIMKGYSSDGDASS